MVVCWREKCVALMEKWLQNVCALCVGRVDRRARKKYQVCEIGYFVSNIRNKRCTRAQLLIVAQDIVCRLSRQRVKWFISGKQYLNKSSAKTLSMAWIRAINRYSTTTRTRKHSCNYAQHNVFVKLVLQLSAQMMYCTIVVLFSTNVPPRTPALTRNYQKHRNPHNNTNR